MGKWLKTRCALKHISLACFAFVFLANTNAIAANINWAPMPTGVNPVLDGQASFVEEWKSANWAPNDQGDGTYYAEWQQDWTATSSSGNHVTYLGITLFDMHNMDAAITQDTADYNVFEYTLANGDSIKGWVFANEDEADDTTWINNSGLGYANIDDRGFLVRKNNDMATDVQWLPGMLEPGDPGFMWDIFYGFFGTSGFNNSVFDMALPGIVNNEANEVYEVALFGPALFGGGGGGVEPCITDIFRTVKDPKDGQPSQILVGQMIGPGHVNAVPEPSTIFLFGIGLLGFITVHLKSKRTV